MINALSFADHDSKRDADFPFLIRLTFRIADRPESISHNSPVIASLE
jgi:hypothetical protein